MLNRSLDLAEEMVIHGAAMDEDWKTVETTEGSEIHRPLSSGINAGMVGEPVASLTDAQEDGAERMGRQDPKEYEYVLDRVTKAVGLLRYRQQDLKVGVFKLHRTDQLPKQHADTSMLAAS